ncbi:MAG TPA: C40 family peptidase [Flavobacteriales bacterium]|nr:C40 family peptidase [Flavobacteriales bacterium]HRO40744.1 C40 family peptidase [Flavobacteriales bacterium]HRP82543.1 C40 family peptidase [Flavobacteriales bacterium]HRQ85610.1 C40 family peptidase [Flavobacteriales bacterium]
MNVEKIAICPLGIVPVRREPDDRAEQVTQWLLGETAQVLERQPKWTRLRFHHDGYEGWADNKQIAWTTDPPEEKPVRSIEQFVHVSTSNGVMLVPFGAVLPSYSAGRFHIGQEKLSFPGRTTAQPNGTAVMRILALKDQWMNTPYLWGGRSPFGVDCSGLTQMLFLAGGKRLQRDAWQQAEQGTTVDSLARSVTGDLAFFQNPAGRIIHVGIVLENRQILHASGRVRIDRLDEEGIFNEAEQQHTHRLHSIRRVV